MSIYLLLLFKIIFFKNFQTNRFWMIFPALNEKHLVLRSRKPSFCLKLGGLACDTMSPIKNKFMNLGSQRYVSLLLKLTYLKYIPRGVLSRFSCLPKTALGSFLHVCSHAYTSCPFYTVQWPSSLYQLHCGVLKDHLSFPSLFLLLSIILDHTYYRLIKLDELNNLWKTKTKTKQMLQRCWLEIHTTQVE